MYNHRYILLASGIVVTILFLLVSGPLYWRLYLGDPMLTDGLFDFRYAIRVDSNVVTSLAVTTVLMAWVLAGVYYYVINSVHFDRWWDWTAVALLIMIIMPLTGYGITASGLDGIEPGLSAEYRDLNLLLQLWTAVLALFWFAVASFSIRWWSSNCRHTPFPQ